ncbi:MAG: RsmE family RNA methyltransferase [Planctomycetota bacterium]
MSAPPAFFLAAPPSEERPPRLAPGEEEHARRVLRLGAGAAVVGLDGEGGRWPLRIAGAGRRGLALVLAGPPAREPAPGEPGAPLPWVEVAVAWPKKARGEEMLGRLVQLGAAAVTPLSGAQGGAAAAPPAPPERWFRIAREAAKQCGRAWLPHLGPRLSPGELLAARGSGVLAVLDPAAALSLDAWLRSLRPAPQGVGTRGRPIVLAIGPEGGFSPEEQEAFLLAGASPVRLAPHILRIETAAEAAMAVAGVVLM